MAEQTTKQVRRIDLTKGDKKGPPSAFLANAATPG
jgi:hypothetical protein